MSKKEKSREREWNLKLFRQKTVTKEELEEDLKYIKNHIENYIIIVDNPSLFNTSIHCEGIKTFLALSPKFLKYLDEDDRKNVSKINSFYKENCGFNFSPGAFTFDPFD